MNKEQCAEKELSIEEGKLWRKAESEDECYEEMDNDFDRFPLPLEFDEMEELKELHFRERRIKLIANRYFRRYINSKNIKP